MYKGCSVYMPPSPTTLVQLCTSLTLVILATATRSASKCPFLLDSKEEKKQSLLSLWKSWENPLADLLLWLPCVGLRVCVEWLGVGGLGGWAPGILVRFKVTVLQLMGVVRSNCLQTGAVPSVVAFAEITVC